MTDHPLRDAMPARSLSARWVIFGTLTLETALHLGGEADERVDMPILRDAKDGVPLLPGTTFAGALRNALADRLAGYEIKEPAEVAQLFGASRGDDEGSQSPLMVFDARGAFPVEHGVELRDGVAISPTTGVAEDHKKYDYEVLPAGTTFSVRVDLLLPAPVRAASATAVDEKSLLASLTAALDAFARGDSAFGAKRSRGLGRVSAVWAAKRFDLGSGEGWMEWIVSDHERPFAANPDQSCIREVLEKASPEHLRPLELLGDERERILIDLEIALVHDILVRSPGTLPGAPDASHLHSGGAAILPGTSLAGAMRAQALRIASLVRAKDAPIWVSRLFGPRFEGQRPTGSSTPQASRLRVGEARLEGSTPTRQTRVAIDRFTQGTVDTALFDEQTEVGGAVTARLELRNPKEGELGLVLLVLKDLLDGSLPVGGTSSVGRGVLRGNATVIWPEGSEGVRRTAKIEPGTPPTGEAASKIDDAIRAFHNAASLSATQTSSNSSEAQ